MNTKKSKRKPATAKRVGGFDLSHGVFVDSAWLHLLHPAFGHELYVGEGVEDNGEPGYAKDPKPVRVKLRRMDSKEMIEKRAKLSQAAMAQSGNKELSEEVDKEINETMLRYSILKFENVYYQGRALDAKKEADKKLFFDMPANYRVQVMFFAGTVEHFFDEGCKG